MSAADTAARRWWMPPRQMQELAFCSSYNGSSNQPAIELADRLAGLCYPQINNFYFTSGGGESTDSNFKLARSYWKAEGQAGKNQGHRAHLGLPRGYLCRDVRHRHRPVTGPLSSRVFPDSATSRRRIPTTTRYRRTAVPRASPWPNELEQEILRQGPETVAMFIAEPVQGAGGVIVPPDDYFPRIREICDQYEVLFVADEVITGFGRTGKLFALDHWGVQPDLVQFAKSITSGYLPLGGIGISDEIAVNHPCRRQALDACLYLQRTPHDLCRGPGDTRLHRTGRTWWSRPRARAPTCWSGCMPNSTVIRTSAMCAARA